MHVGHPPAGLQGSCGPDSSVPSLEEPQEERRAHLWPQVTAWPQGRAAPHPWHLNSQPVWGEVVREHFPILAGPKGDELLHSWGKCHQWDKEGKKERKERKKSELVLLSAFIPCEGTSLGPGYLGGVCPWALPVQSHKGLIFPSLSRELGSEKIAGEADASGEMKEKKHSPLCVPQLSPLGSRRAAILPCHSSWAGLCVLLLPQPRGRGMAARGGSREKLRIWHFSLECAGLALGSSPRL